MARLNLSAPWYLFYREIEEMFKNDPEVRVIFDEDNMNIKLYVKDANKADALEQLMIKEKNLGTVTITVSVIPANNAPKTEIPEFSDTEDLYERALYDNPALSYVTAVYGIYNNPITYVVFANEVVQYWADNLGDANGLISTLYQEIAKDIFVSRNGANFCTDVPATQFVYQNGNVCEIKPLSLGKPLGEWP